MDIITYLGQLAPTSVNCNRRLLIHFSTLPSVSRDLLLSWRRCWVNLQLNLTQFDVNRPYSFATISNALRFAITSRCKKCKVHGVLLKPRLHDTTCCQTGCQTDLTTGCIGCQSVVQPVLTTGWTNSGCSFNTVVKPVVKPVVQPVWQPVVSCKRGVMHRIRTSHGFACAMSTIFNTYFIKRDLE